RGVRAGRAHRGVDRIEHRDPLDLLAALARRDAADHLRAVLDRELGVELTHAAHALHEQARVLVAQDRHQAAIPFAAATAFSPASPSVSAGVMFKPDCARIARPSAAFVPWSRTMSGTETPSSPAAATTPSAIRSQRTIPPKMLTRIARTFGSRRISLKASFTF